LVAVCNPYHLVASFLVLFSLVLFVTSLVTTTSLVTAPSLVTPSSVTATSLVVADILALANPRIVILASVSTTYLVAIGITLVIDTHPIILENLLILIDTLSIFNFKINKF
jgi:hypothetical protein